jgi:hypothetical protein
MHLSYIVFQYPVFKNVMGHMIMIESTKSLMLRNSSIKVGRDFHRDTPENHFKQ